MKQDRWGLFDIVEECTEGKKWILIMIFNLYIVYSLYKHFPYGTKTFLVRFTTCLYLAVCCIIKYQTEAIVFRLDKS